MRPRRRARAGARAGAGAGAGEGAGAGIRSDDRDRSRTLVAAGAGARASTGARVEVAPPLDGPTSFRAVEPGSGLDAADSSLAPIAPFTSFSILTVCTGNICRSPLAEVSLLQALSCGDTGLDERLFSVTSAGTRAEPGDLAPPESVASAAEAGFELSEHRARELTPSLLARTDLVLALGRDHRRAAATMLPRITRKSFTLREFARLCDAFADDDVANLSATFRVPHDRLVEAVRLAAASRGTLPAPPDPSDFDVADPYRRSNAVYDDSRRTTLDAVAVIADFFRRLASA